MEETDSLKQILSPIEAEEYSNISQTDSSE